MGVLLKLLIAIVIFLVADWLLHLVFNSVWSTIIAAILAVVYLFGHYSIDERY